MVNENPGEGTGTVYASVDYALMAGSEIEFQRLMLGLVVPEDLTQIAHVDRLASGRAGHEMMFLSRRRSAVTLALYLRSKVRQLGHPDCRPSFLASR